MSEEFRQEMPPAGGYRPFNYNRTYAKTLWGPGLFVAFNLGTAITGYFYNIKDFRHRRLVLRIMKKNRELEKDLMKEVPGWKVGTWYGEPIYFTLGDQWIEPTALEANIHLKHNDWHKNAYWRQEGPWPTKPWLSP
uniref:NADH dehydrogenase [ubiquinone] 1 alpha subcomplex subunit 13 n=1 Tax=Meloidogyne javanica TaxID=6303 RepID=A0A915LD23_MELJA